MPLTFADRQCTRLEKNEMLMLGMGKFKGNEIKGITHARIYLTSVFTEPRAMLSLFPFLEDFIF